MAGTLEVIVKAVLSSVMSGIVALLFKPLSNFMEATGYLDADTYSVMSQYCEDLTEKAKNEELSEAFCRDEQIDTVIDILTREGKGNPCLIGEAGVGKTALVEGLAVKIARGEVPEEFKDKKIIKVNMVNLIAGRSYGNGNPVSRIRALFDNARNDKNIILFIDEIHQIVQCHAGDIFKMYLDRGDVKVIAATTTNEFGHYISEDPALERRFSTVNIEEPSLEETVKILAGISPKLEKENDVQVSNEAVLATVDLTNRHMKNKNFPDKAIDVIRTAVKIASRRPVGERVVTEKDIKDIVSKETGIPLDNLDEVALDALNERVQNLKSHIVGQDLAVDKVFDALIKSRLGLSDSNRPRASFIFTGPSGVGKTLLCNLVKEEVGSIVEVDMSYYKDRSSVSDFTSDRLNSSRIGICNRVWKKPYSVVVFDKIEKACPEVLDMITSILEKGYMLSSSGKKIDFTDTIVIMTSNIGDDIIVDEKSDNIEKSVVSKVKSRFSNGLCQKVDDILVFKKLSNEDVKKITSKLLKETSEQLKKLKIKVEFDDEVVDFLSKQNDDNYSGMLSVSKQIENKVFVPISNMFASKKISESNTVRCVVVDDEIKFNLT